MISELFLLQVSDMMWYYRYSHCFGCWEKNASCGLSKYSKKYSRESERCCFLFEWAGKCLFLSEKVCKNDWKINSHFWSRKTTHRIGTLAVAILKVIETKSLLPFWSQKNDSQNGSYFCNLFLRFTGSFKSGNLQLGAHARNVFHGRFGNCASLRVIHDV